MNLDLFLLHIVNGWCGSPVLDQMALFTDRINLLKGGLTVAVFWWFWYAGDERTRFERRQIIVVAFLATFAAIFLSRAMAATLPFRLRPMYTPGIGYHAPSIHLRMDMETWSSFPSDHAAMWFALSYGVWRLSRRFGWVAYAYSVIWICLPRLYLGIHYPSDLLVGALVGLGCGWGAFRLPLRRSAKLCLLIERRYPQWFYPVAFLVAFEIADMFNDVRKVLHGLRLLHAHHNEVLLAAGAVIALGIGAGAALIGRIKPPRVGQPVESDTTRTR